ncbi:MAG: porin family protein [Bacteroidia bacterium]
MKTIQVIAMAAFLIVSGTAFAQNEETDNREKFQIGLKTGLNYSNVYNARGENLNTDGKFGFVGGGVVRIPIDKYFGLQPEVLFSQKGFKGQGMLLGSEYDFTRTTTYLDIPLQFAVKPSEFITIMAGPQYSYLLKQKDTFISSSTSFSQEQEFKNDNIRKNILGLVGGFDISLRHLILGARTGWDIQNNNGNGTSQTPRYKNAWVQGTIGYAFYE